MRQTEFWLRRRRMTQGAARACADAQRLELHLELPRVPEAGLKAERTAAESPLHGPSKTDRTNARSA